MKKAIVLLLLIAGIQHNLFAQAPPVDKTSYDYLVKKKRMFNTMGWVSLGTGATLIFVGAVATLGSALDNGKTGAGPAVADIGLVTMLGSIPLFIASHKKKVQAAVALKNEQSFSPFGEKKNYPSLAAHVSF